MDAPLGRVRIDSEALEVVVNLPGSHNMLRWSLGAIQRAAALRAAFHQTGVVVVGPGRDKAYLFCGPEATVEMLGVLARLGVPVEDRPVRVTWWQMLRGRG